MRISNPVSSFIQSGRKKSQAAEADRQRLKQNRDKAQGMANVELEAYRKGTFKPHEVAEMDKIQAEKLAQSEKLYDQAGVPNEQQQKTLTAVIGLDRQIMEYSKKEESWAKAMRSLGYSMEQTLALVSSYKKEQIQLQQAYTGFMTTVAKIGAIALTGGAAAAPILGAEAIKGSQGGATAPTHQA
jgi:hypothetical protein